MLFLSIQTDRPSLPISWINPGKETVNYKLKNCNALYATASYGSTSVIPALPSVHMNADELGVPIRMLYALRLG